MANCLDKKHVWAIKLYTSIPCVELDAKFKHFGALAQSRLFYPIPCLRVLCRHDGYEFREKADTKM